MIKKLKKWLLSGDWIVVLFVVVGVAVWVTMLTIDREPSSHLPAKVQEITLKDGTKCVVLKGFYSDNAITCDFAK